MLNLSFIFDRALSTLTAHPDRLPIHPLPAAIYMMQLDVINHYRYALTHYLTLSLDEPFLQNSSLGPPYQKWAFVVNKDFETLSFTIQNLLRYTSRLFHEATRPTSRDLMQLRDMTQLQEMKTASNTFTGPICEMRNKRVGITVQPDHQLIVSAICTEQSSGGETVQSRSGQITSRTVDIRDRAVLDSLRAQGFAELAVLAGRNERFRNACNAYYATHNVTDPFENLNQSYWI